MNQPSRLPSSEFWLIIKDSLFLTYQERLCFTVWDSGIGISQDDLAKLFLPFTQLDSSTTRRYEGVGIGLSLVWHLTEMQKGEVVVDSEVGSGSRFQIHFPWHRDS